MTAPLVVVGDFLLDIDVLTVADRLAPDSAAPVLTEQVRRQRPGGAALAAMLAALDGRREVVLVAPVVGDNASDDVIKLLGGMVEVVAIPTTGATSVKTRLRCHNQTVARLDHGGDVSISALPSEIDMLIRSAAGVLISDYGGATTRHAGLRALLTEAAHRIPTVWDPHPKGGSPVAGVSLLTPNAQEAAALGDLRPGAASDIASLRRAAETLLERWQVRSVAVTMGSRGALLCFGTGSGEVVSAPRLSAGDACGAGDCFAATAALELAAGGLPSDAVTMAVESASRFVAAGGVSSLDALATGEDWAQPETAESVVARVRGNGGVVVATGGCFDLLHAGHIETISAARSLGDCLVVCLNSDESVRRIKGESRPLQSQADRMRVLAALRDVDAVIVFDDDTPSRVLSELRPDIWVKGGDYTGQRLPEADLLAQWGGEVVTVGYLGGRSTTSLLARSRA